MSQPTAKLKPYSRPSFWLVVSAGIYLLFEVFNATLTCTTLSLTLITGGLGFLGFWSLVATIVLLAKEAKQTKRFSWLWVAIVVLLVALTLADKFFGKTCYF